MRTSALRRPLVVLLSLAAAVLGCARADVGLMPVTPDYATRQPPTATITSVAPTATVAVASPTAKLPPTAVSASTGYPAPAAVQPSQPPAATLAAPSPAPTQTPSVAPSPAPSRTPPSVKATATATSAPPTVGPPLSNQPVAIPANATFTQKMVVTGEGGEVIGDPGYLIDNRTVTWAALDGGHTAWVFDLGIIQKMGGVRVYAQKPRSGEATTLLAIDASSDGTTWQTVLVGMGNCGEPNCDVIPQMVSTDIGFNPVSARYLRLRSGPNRFGFAEVAIAIVP